MCRAGDLQMINDFSQGELCPPPPMCCGLLPSLTRLFAGMGWGRVSKGVGGGGLREARRQSLPIRRKTQEHKPWVEQAGTSCPIVITFIFAKTGIQFLYLEMYSLNSK